MKDLVISTSAASSTLAEASESALSALPEALQPPTKPVSTGFSIWLAVANTVLILCNVGISTILLPLQVEQMDKANKVGILGLGLGLTALLALITTPIAGALSDRTISRFGRRRPWIFFGTIMGALALAIMIRAGNVVILFIGWGLLQIAYNLLTTTLNAIVPDQVPDTQRGTVSAIMGISAPIGFIVGETLVALTSPPMSYVVMIAVLLVILIPYALFLRDKVLPREHRASFNLWDFLRNFWINPRKHPDFGWTWITRFLTLLGYYMGPSYLFYYLQDDVHYPQKLVTQGVATVLATSTLVMLVFIFIGGMLSDRFQRRKIFVVIASAIIALGLLILGFFPVWTIVLFAFSLVGLGFGIYVPVDLALITQVLPSANDRGKDLGIINIAYMLAQTLAPLMSAFFVTQFHSYAILFTVGALVTLLSGILIQPIKSVR